MQKVWLEAIRMSKRDDSGFASWQKMKAGLKVLFIYLMYLHSKIVEGYHKA